MDKYWETENPTSFVDSADTCMAYKNPEVIKHFPPQLLVGRQIGEMTGVGIKSQDEVTVTLCEIQADWKYSNPTGTYNLSIVDKPFYKKTEYKTITYEQYKMNKLSNEEKLELESDEEDVEKEVKEAEPFEGKKWHVDKNTGPVLLQLVIEANKKCVVNCRLKVADNETKNVNLPISTITKKFFTKKTEESFIFTKIDPSKAGWGDIEIDLEVKEYKTKTT